MELEPCVMRFLLRAVIAEHANRFPLVKVPERGHAKASFDLGLDRFAGEVAAKLLALGIAWTAHDRS
jgi:hypothetical protein